MHIASTMLSDLLPCSLPLADGFTVRNAHKSVPGSEDRLKSLASFSAQRERCLRRHWLLTSSLSDDEPLGASTEGNIGRGTIASFPTCVEYARSKGCEE